jgi:hypothetical protein
VFHWQFAAEVTARRAPTLAHDVRVLRVARASLMDFHPVPSPI